MNDDYQKLMAFKRGLTPDQLKKFATRLNKLQTILESQRHQTSHVPYNNADPYQTRPYSNDLPPAYQRPKQPNTIQPIAKQDDFKDKLDEATNEVLIKRMKNKLFQ